MIRQLCSVIYRWWSPRYEVYEITSARVVRSGLSRLEAMELVSGFNDDAEWLRAASVYRWRMQK